MKHLHRQAQPYRQAHSHSQAQPRTQTQCAKAQPHAHSGFTLIEVMLFLAVTGMILIGVLGGTYANIATQRYNDSVRSFAEFLRQVYSEVISPESIGSSDPDNQDVGSSNDQAIYGKLIVFGLEDEAATDRIYTATIVGDVTPPTTSNGFIADLGAANVRLFCGTDDGSFASTVASYTMLWDAQIRNTSLNQFQGSVLIARSPTSGTIHTAFTNQTFNIRDYCQPGSSSASSNFSTALKDTPGDFSTTDDVNFCVLSDNSTIVRNVRLAADGRNTSAVNILAADDPEAACQR